MIQWFILEQLEKKLRDLINENDFKTGVGGDNNSSLGYLIKKNKFKEHFKKTDFQLNII